MRAILVRAVVGVAIGEGCLADRSLPCKSRIREMDASDRPCRAVAVFLFLVISRLLFSLLFVCGAFFLALYDSGAVYGVAIRVVSRKVVSWGRVGWRFAMNPAAFTGILQS